MVVNISLPAKITYKSCDVYRLLDHLYARYCRENKCKGGLEQRFGDNINPKKDLVHIQSHVTFGHKASSVQDIEESEDGSYTILLNHLSLAGVYGPLPDVYGEFIADKQNRDMRDFLDIFHHRLMALLYRLYRKNRVYLGSIDPRDNIIGRILHHLTGLSLFDGLDASTPFHFRETGVYPLFSLFWKNGPSISGVKELVAGYFQVQTKVFPFLGGWVYLDRSEYNHLNQKYNVLNKDLVIGHKVWDDTYGFRVSIGPLDFETYLKFIPPMHQNFSVLKELLFYYVGSQYYVPLVLHLKSTKVPTLSLGQKSFLNFTTWISKENNQVKDTRVETVMLRGDG